MATPKLWPDLTVNEILDLLQARYDREGRPTAVVLRSQTKAIREALGARHPADVTTEDLIAYREARAHVVQRNTVNRELEFLRTAYRAATRCTRRHPGTGLVVRLLLPDEIPPDFCLFRGASKPRQVYLRPDEFARVHDELQQPAKDIAAFLYFTGWRVGAALDLEWRQVHAEDGVIRPRAGAGHANKLRGCAPIYGELARLLERRWLMMRALNGRQVPRDYRARRVFTRAKGEDVVSIRSAWDGARRRADLRHVELRDLRHCARTNLRRAGVAPVLIRACLGHATDSMSEWYDVVDSGDLREVGTKMEEWMGNATPPAPPRGGGGARERGDDPSSGRDRQGAPEEPEREEDDERPEHRDDR